MSEVSTIIGRLLEIKEQTEVLEVEVSALWRAFYQIADREAGEGKAYRYLDEEKGLVIGRIIRKSENINPTTLEEQLTHDQWLSVSDETRILNPAKLELGLDAKGKSKIPEDAVEASMERKKTASKFGPRKASKEDLADLAEAREREAR